MSLCYITASARRGPLDFNGRDADECLATTITQITRRWWQYNSRSEVENVKEAMVLTRLACDGSTGGCGLASDAMRLTLAG